MAKFYVQSGTFRSVVAADSTRKAALWAVHQVMQQVLPTDEDTDSLPHATADTTSSQPTSPIQNHDRLDGSTPVAVLDSRVRISERGYDRSDCAEMPTMEVVAEWNQMVLTLDRLHQMMRRA